MSKTNTPRASTLGGAAAAAALLASSALATSPKGEKDRVIRTKEVAGITHLQVIALQEGGRHRAGRHWPQEHVTVAIDEFTDDQVEQLLGDKKLVVLPISDPDLDEQFGGGDKPAADSSDAPKT